MARLTEFHRQHTFKKAKGSVNKQEQVGRSTIKGPKSRTYIFERTGGFFAGQPDKPCSGVARFKLANSGAAPLRPTASTAAAHSSTRLGADPLASTTAGVEPWPLPTTRDT
jgi:hypothetical protein